MRRQLAPVPLLLLLAAVVACAPHKPAPPKADNFPVVVPFAIDRAGTKVMVEFELPNAIDPYIEEPTLRPVFIGLRRISKDGDLMTDEEFQQWRKVREHLLHGELPARVQLWRYEQGDWQPVVLYQSHRDIAKDRTWYEKLPLDGRIEHLGPGSTDNDALLAAGKYDQEKVYDAYEFVRISPPMPGRYRLEVTSLSDHPVLSGSLYELLVSNYYQYGVRP
jgi:hypothetical protein